MKWLGYFALGGAVCVCLLLALFAVALVCFMSVSTYEEFGLMGFLIPVGLIAIPTFIGWLIWKLKKW